MTLNEALSDYVSRPDPALQWSVVSDIAQEVSAAQSGVTRVDLNLVSQVWHGAEWRHRLTLFVPETPQCLKTCLLTVMADGPCTPLIEEIGRDYASTTGRIAAFLFDVPNQPLFGGLTEDALIVHTLLEHLETGDPECILLLPMVKSAAAAMTAIDQYSATLPGRSKDEMEFVVSGASKRGWTTWLIGAVDSRVIAIAPVVFDNLNVFEQIPHQLEVFQGYSEQISDYSNAGLTEGLNTPEGYALARIIDPYTYVERISIPKLIINGANDQYWATDAINLYWGGLDGPKTVLHVPNQSHYIQDAKRFRSAIKEFFNASISGTFLPTLEPKFSETASTCRFELQDMPGLRRASVWVAISESRDFRNSKWQQMEMTKEGLDQFSGTVRKRRALTKAAIVEAEFDGEYGPYWISAPVQIIGKRNEEAA